MELVSFCRSYAKQLEGYTKTLVTNKKGCIQSKLLLGFHVLPTPL